MKLHLNKLNNINLFTAHQSDSVAVNGEVYHQNIAVQASLVDTAWPATRFEELTEACFEYFLTQQPEVLLLGTGTQQRFPHPKLYRALTNAGIGVESMDTAAACRTYNILVAEDRKVIAAILI